MVRSAHKITPAPEPPAEAPPRALRVLLVEDCEDDAYLLARQIRQRFPGTHCERVDSRENMQRALAERDWDIVISDHTMPGFDSLAALQTLKASGKDIPFIIYSGDLPEQTGAHAMRDGAQDFVIKTTPERLLPAIERELAHQQTRLEKAHAERSIKRLAHFDELTGLPNRSLFMERLDRRLRATEPEEARAAVCYLDLDRFMRINETFGYAAGDTLIRQVGERLSQSLCGSGVVARMGRDEFALYRMLEPHEHETLPAERLMQCFAAPFTQSGQELYLTPSVGIAIWPEHGGDALSLLRNAESAMFNTKQNGRKGYQVYRAEINDGSRRRLALEAALRQAIQREQLRVVYQPFYDTAQGRITGIEALVRWEHPDLGIVTPQDFIPVADETGLILPIGEWVLRQACAQMRLWHQQGLGELSIAVNVSATQFRDPAIADRIEEIVRDTGVAPHALELEITEGVAMQDAPQAGQIMRRLKDLGVQIAIDDFGTGYSSLAYLKRFPIDILKIDQSFVRDVNEDEDDAAIVRAILALSRSLKLTAHAEGIETREQAQFMLREGCQRLQGYFYGRPSTAGEMSTRLRDNARIE